MARGMGASVALEVLSGEPNYLGVIDFTGTSKTNSQATVPFNAAAPALALMTLLLQPDQDCYVLPVATATGTVTSATGVKLTAGERVIIGLTELKPWIAVLRVSASGNLSVWEMK